MNIKQKYLENRFSNQSFLINNVRVFVERKKESPDNSLRSKFILKQNKTLLAQFSFKPSEKNLEDEIYLEMGFFDIAKESQNAKIDLECFLINKTDIQTFLLETTKIFLKEMEADIKRTENRLKRIQSWDAV